MVTLAQQQLATQETRDIQRAKQFFEDKLAYTTGPVELKRAIDQKEAITVVDVRAPEDYAKGHIPGAVSIPKDKLAQKLEQLSQEKTTIVYCYSTVCHLAAKAALILSQNGYPVMELDGGWDEWVDHEMPVEH